MKIIASPKSWIEGEAVRQLKNTLELPGMQFVIGLPDLHPGKGNPIGEQTCNAFSIAHGAGRKWSRGAIKDRLKGKVTPASLTQTELGSIVICDDKELLFEEAPQAYKSIDTVIADLKDAGLIKVVAIMRPVITYKTSQQGE